MSKRLLVALVYTLTTPGLLVAGALFTGVGDLPGGSAGSRAMGVSADGTIVVGDSSSSLAASQAFRWENGLLVGLDVPGGTDTLMDANAVSNDGSIIVGSIGSTELDNRQPYVWDNGVLTILGDPDPFSNEGRSYDVTPDGATVVGDLRNASFDIEGFRYESGALSGIGLGPGNSYSTGRSVSDDGEVIVGWGNNAAGWIEAMRWEGGVVTLLGDIPTGQHTSRANAISGDGSTIVGSGRPDFGWEAVRWTSDLQLHTLGAAAAGYSFSHALAVSHDGSTIVGEASGLGSGEAFFWDAANGFRLLEGVLVSEYGVNLAGWELTSATGISADGNVIVGRGTNPAGENEGWVATLREPQPQVYVDPGVVSWQQFGQPPGMQFDLVHGDLATLRATAGDFQAATTGCLAENTTSNTALDDTPSTGVTWFLVRKITAAGNGSYDEECPSQVAPRDAGINSAPGSCL